VISLEKCLGLESTKSREETRLIVVQAPQKDAGQWSCYRIMLQAVAPIRMLTLPIECRPVSAEWIPAGHLARGVYEWKNNFLVVAHIAKILDGL
jgi:chemotaxis signal transduction protein